MQTLSSKSSADNTTGASTTTKPTTSLNSTRCIAIPQFRLTATLTSPRRSPRLVAKQSSNDAQQLTDTVSPQGARPLRSQSRGIKRGREQHQCPSRGCASVCKGPQICPLADQDELKRERKRPISFKWDGDGIVLSPGYMARHGDPVKTQGRNNNDAAAAAGGAGACAPNGDDDDDPTNPTSGAHGDLPTYDGLHVWRETENPQFWNFVCRCPRHQVWAPSGAQWAGPQHFCPRCNTRVCAICRVRIDMALRIPDHPLNCRNTLSRCEAEQAERAGRFVRDHAAEE